MNLNTYQARAKETDELAPGTNNEIRLAMGVADEAGEVLGKYKKSLQDSEELADAGEIIDELGDVLWYIALLADELDAPLTNVAMRNLEKLEDRKEREVLAGSGDH